MARIDASTRSRYIPRVRDLTRAGLATRLPEDIEADWLEATREWALAGATRRLWEADSSLWTGSSQP